MTKGATGTSSKYVPPNQDGDSSPPDIATLIAEQTKQLSLQIFTAKEEMKKHMDDSISAVKTAVSQNKAAIVKNTLEINKVTGTANEARDDLKDLRGEHEAEVTELKEFNQDLKKEVNSLHNHVALLTVRMKVQQERTEDQTNRNLRKTIIIRGVPEAVEETTWDQTKEAAVQALSTATQMDIPTLQGMFERIHRGGPFALPLNKRRTQPRKIHALLYDWNNLGKLKKAISTNGRNSGIYIDQHYGPVTTERRNKANIKRRELIEEKAIVAGYVAFPAKLYGKYQREDKNYALIEDFSKVPIFSKEEESLAYENIFDSDT